MKKIFSALFLTMMMTGCAQQTFSVKPSPAQSQQKITTHAFFVSGIGQKKTIDAAAVCGGAEKIVKTEVQQTFVNGLIGVLTLGIYTPREARVYCAN